MHLQPEVAWRCRRIVEALQALKLMCWLVLHQRGARWLHSLIYMALRGCVLICACHCQQEAAALQEQALHDTH